jgi:hypothetical protein
MAYKCKPITAKASEASKPSPNKYMANLVSQVAGAYASKKFVDAAKGFGEGLDRVSKQMKNFE